MEYVFLSEICHGYGYTRPIEMMSYSHLINKGYSLISNLSPSISPLKKPPCFTTTVPLITRADVENVM